MVELCFRVCLRSCISNSPNSVLKHLQLITHLVTETWVGKEDRNYLARHARLLSGLWIGQDWQQERENNRIGNLLFFFVRQPGSLARQSALGRWTDAYTFSWTEHISFCQIRPWGSMEVRVAEYKQADSLSVLLTIRLMGQYFRDPAFYFPYN